MRMHTGLLLGFECCGYSDSYFERNYGSNRLGIRRKVVENDY